MAGEVSFDIVSDFDHQELVNALDQVRREVATRFDFKGIVATLELGKEEIVLRASDEFRARALRDLLETKAVRRGLSLKIFDWDEVTPAGGNTVRQVVGLRRGLSEDLARKISKLVRDDFPKVHPQVQGDAVRVSSKSKDELQRVIVRMRQEAEGYDVAIQFQNYR
jgi:cyclic-di-GMP-binding protein